METYTKKTAISALYVSISVAAASIIAYLTRILLARYLTAEAYGLFFAVFSFTTFLCFFSDFGISSSVVKYLSEYLAQKKYAQIKANIAAAFIIGGISTTAVCLLLLVLSQPLAQFYFKNELAYVLLDFLVIYVFFNITLNIMKQMFRGLQMMKIFSLVEPLKNLLVFSLAWIFFASGMQLLSAPFAYIFSTAAVSVLIFAALVKIKLGKQKSSNKMTEAKKLISFGVPMILTSFGALIIGSTDTLMLTYITTLQDVGIYNVVLPSALMFMFFAQVLSTIALPFASELWARRDSEKLREGLRMLYKYCYLIMLPPVLGVLVWSKLVISSLFGEAYSSGSLSMQILLVGVLFYCIANINSAIITGIGKPKEITKIILFAALLNLVSNAIFIPLLGIVGAAGTSALSFFIVFVLSLLKIKKHLSMHIPIVLWIKQLIIGLVFAGVVYTIKYLLHTDAIITSIISCFAGLFVYALGVLLLKLVDIDEIKKYLRLVRA
jgi:stage V sporulation protein B